MRYFRKLLFMIMLAAVCLVLTACGNKIEGAWKLTGGNAVSAIYSLEYGDTLETAGAEVIFRFKDDGVLSIAMIRDGIEKNETGTWEAGGDDLALIIDGQTIKCSYAINDDELTIFFTYEGQNASFVLKRV